jgi:hypothetical protein
VRRGNCHRAIPELWLRDTCHSDGKGWDMKMDDVAIQNNSVIRNSQGSQLVIRDFLWDSLEQIKNSKFEYRNPK